MAFPLLKPICVPLLGNALLTPTTIPIVDRLLTQLEHTIAQLPVSGHVLLPPTISYVFFPLSALLTRNDVSTIPDRVLEKIFAILALLAESWWWDMDTSVWQQILMLSSAILGGIDRKQKGKDRDDETKTAAATCLWALLRPRSFDEDPSDGLVEGRATLILSKFVAHARGPQLIPVVGQTLDTLLATAESQHLPLQRVSLKVLSALIEHFITHEILPSVLPGIVSTTCKIALGTAAVKGWANGDIVAAALLAMQCAILATISDDVCIQAGAIRRMENLEDLVSGMGNTPHAPGPSPSNPYATQRTASWLQGTASQLHRALNSLAPLLKHPTPAALIGLSHFSASVLAATSQTVPQSQPLLISFLLSLQRSSFHRVAQHANSSLRELLAPQSAARHRALQILLEIARNSLSALPHLLLSRSDSKVEHAAGIVESICNLSIRPLMQVSHSDGVAAVSSGVGKLLGPHGGVEKWGWRLLSTLEFANPPVIVTHSSSALLMLESDPSAAGVPFPELTLRHAGSRNTYDTLAAMFRALGGAAGEECLFSVGWFVDVGLGGRGTTAVTALWCACRLLEGASHVNLDVSTQPTLTEGRGKRLEKLARALARRISETWDEEDEGEGIAQGNADVKRPAEDDNALIEHVHGLINVGEIGNATPSTASSKDRIQPLLHRALSLQLLSVCAGILEARFLPLLLHTLYPTLHSIVQPQSLVSTSGLAVLHFIAAATSYATPANLLLSNFDYALDAVSRRLTRRWLDVDATRVLAVLVRLVGRDVVRKAGDVVEECFDRLDEYHGYEIIVDGLVEVLGEVVKVIEDDDDNRIPKESRSDAHRATPRVSDGARLELFAEWFDHRHDPPNVEEDVPTEFGLPLAPDSDGARAPQEGAQKAENPEDDPFAEPPPTPSQALTKQIVSRSLYFLTHASPAIRARILLLLASAVPVLPASALLPSVHHAWPFVLNRFADGETFVVAAAATFVEALATHVGDFMFRRVWDDVWPRFREILRRFEAADSASAVSRRARGGAGIAASAYTHAHRLCRAIIKTMAAAARGVPPLDSMLWEVIVAFRRFLHRHAHEELQMCARELYGALCENNEDAVWLALEATQGTIGDPVGFLKEERWDIVENVKMIFAR